MCVSRWREFRLWLQACRFEFEQGEAGLDSTGHVVTAWASDGHQHTLKGWCLVESDVRAVGVLDALGGCSETDSLVRPEVEIPDVFG